jgi:hypothetical protein
LENSREEGPVLSCGVDHQIGFFHGDFERFFAKDGLALTEKGEGAFGMSPAGGGDGYRVQVVSRS